MKSYCWDTAQLNNALHRALCDVHGSPIKGQALMKVHVGEPKCATRMKPSLVTGFTAMFH